MKNLHARPRNPQAALERLKEGNRRFTAGHSTQNQISTEVLTHLSKRQRPFAIVLGCSDSRVPVELIFDQGFGDLFVIRLAGNVIAQEVLGSVQFAHQNLGTSLLVVLGHEGCGAVRASLAFKFKKASQPARIQSLVKMILPGLEEIDSSLPANKRLQAAVEANVRWSMQQVSSTPEAKRSFKEKGNLLIVGAVYEMGTGKVRWLDAE